MARTRNPDGLTDGRTDGPTFGNKGLEFYGLDFRPGLGALWEFRGYLWLKIAHYFGLGDFFSPPSSDTNLWTPWTLHCPSIMGYF